MLDEHESIGIFDVVMDGVQQTARLSTRTVHVFEPEANDLVEGIGLGLHSSDDDDHTGVLTPVVGSGAASSETGRSHWFRLVQRFEDRVALVTGSGVASAGVLARELGFS